MVLTDRNVAGVDFTSRQIPAISVAPDPPRAAEGEDAGFTFTRNGATTAPLKIPFRLSGTAQPPRDYPPLFVNYVTIPAGERSTRLPLVTFADTDIEGAETITLSVKLPDEIKRTMVENGQPTEITLYYPGW